MASSTVAGVDWAGGQWLVVRLRDGSYDTCSVEPDFETLWQEHHYLDRILIDVPIGLPDEGTLAQRERLDSLARSVTGFSSSVFPVPSRGAADLANEDESYEAVAQQNQGDIDKGLRKQSHQLAKAAGQVDAVLQEDDESSEKVIESHPEVCFRGLLGEQLQHKKSWAPGLGERLQAIGEQLEQPGALLGSITGDLIGTEASVDVDDVVDALALAVVAQTDDDIRYLPADPRADSAGIPMRMAYWADERLPRGEDR
ncbi:DUF429 domain-containing protein [Haloarchaeobius baliensis]|uniref:DUF429 domain-containing protein n=1 Tax=Haloarchaeobius baliensis TaxID=1670458 RepID=UPI003F882631